MSDDRCQMGDPEPEAGEFLDDRQRPYDIYARVFRFAVGIIRFVRTFPRTLEAQEIGRQLMRAGPGVGANMEEADMAESKRDFVHKVRIACKEARESRYWLRLCLASEIGDRDQGKALAQEASGILRVLSSIIKNTEKGMSNEARPR